ncbi:MAG: hypothetical protein HY552_04725 [Elusimicrobia bacterium]|nr:hypothetical protein [Elusimicrobiota bacterium]
MNHNNKKLTKRYMGWGPEDDPEYEYPDTHFYPEKYVDAKGVRRRGTIKANITEKFIQTMDLGTELGRNNALAAAGVRTFGRQFFAHEVTHERQYHAGPVQDLASVSGAVVNGLARRKVLEETKRKINYERQAFEVDRRYGLGHEKELLALADALEEYAKAHPEEFGEKGSRRLLALDAPNPVVGRYLREETQNINLGNRFPPTAVIIYEGQYIPAELVWKLKQLNDTNTAIRRGVQTMGVSLPPLHLQAKVMGIRSDWNRYMKAGPISQALKDSFPYLKDVEKRFNAEMHRFNRPGSLR